jgi:hypothetical protein
LAISRECGAWRIAVEIDRRRVQLRPLMFERRLNGYRAIGYELERAATANADMFGETPDSSRLF